MEKTSEALIRSTLHDMANVLAGVRGIIDLTLPGQPISQRDRDRLGAVIQEGVATLERSRHLAVSTLPESDLEPGPTWREVLLEDLDPLGVLFRCRFELTYQGAPEWDQWPGKLLNDYVRAVTRQVLPYAKAAVLGITCCAGPDGWSLRWSPAPTLPEALTPGPEDRPMDICSRWAARAGAVLGASLSCEGESLVARLPREAAVRTR
jgi:hypothetical protein